MSDNGSPPPPGTGPIADRRQEFEELSRRHRERADELAFIEHKIEIVTSDPDLTAEEKAAAIAELRRALE
ncbi:hypothetical protein MSTE_02976 [Mycobacteroides stephanolepidis]|uniref:Uncharacterized protein n=1 Tax=[Mycobacterium] stephanolepidis TaxID=1520670 RepID=A0A1Z4EZB3_9MYCO|nr:hypothetical protein [[Mycobacterium] stephanolepidis]BAX98281.1 hypothetical protein MSTE_02976 [[Mycobacterium] stephanolepidis]